MDPTAPVKQCLNTALLICCQVLFPVSVQVVVSRQSGQTSTRQQVWEQLRYPPGMLQNLHATFL